MQVPHVLLENTVHAAFRFVRDAKYCASTALSERFSAGPCLFLKLDNYIYMQIQTNKPKAT